jgi:signal transduction histidine kinase/putative methionine-R-sulfoxide reductase with GAF domain
MPSEVSTVSGDQSVEELRRELVEAREQQAATAEILRVISSSPMNLQQVFAEIATGAARLCEAYDATIHQADAGLLHLVAHHGPIQAGPTMPLVRGALIGRAVLERRGIQVADLPAERTEYPEGSGSARRLGWRATLAVPLIRAGEAIGVIAIRRTEARPFSDKQIALLETFAKQAVIAIENARLFEAEQASKRDLQESLKYQTATSEVLSVISRSKVDLQPVFGAILDCAVRLCAADQGGICKVEDGQLDLIEYNPSTPDVWAVIRESYPRPVDTTSLTGRAVVEARVIHVPDTEAPTAPASRLKGLGFRSQLSVPLLHSGQPIGVLALQRQAPGPFSPAQIALVETFADQAVIAIENTRLFEEVQTRTRELQESLEYQTAISDVLAAISRSPTQLQPVLETIVGAAGRLCQSECAYLFILQNGKFVLLAHDTITDPEFFEYLKKNPIEPGQRGSITARVVREGRTIHVHDTFADPEYGSGPITAAKRRTVLSVPLLREGTTVGAITLDRKEVSPFTDKQIELVTTFADQAVIAIENARLFEEVQARNRDLTALGQVGRAVSSTLDLNLVLKIIVDRAVELSETDGGSIFYYQKETGRFQLGETTGLDAQVVGRIRNLDIAAGKTGLDEAIVNRQPLQLTDLTKRASNPLRDVALEAGLHAALIVPLLGSEGALGALVLQRRRTGDFQPSVVSLMQSFADQSAIALENARLFDEIAQKSRELEIASQHKSQFVANMSHELRTPLAAILGYAELMQEGFYEPLGQKSLDALTRIRSNGKHLLGLINTVLDIAKIESGQFTLNMAEYDIESVVETVRSATESLAQYKRLALKTEVAESLPTGLGDEQRLTQVLLNLVGNAIKFTDTGEVCVSAKAVNGHLNVSVTDTGPGIPVEHQARIFDQFHQVDSSNTKAKGGTGLGLAIAKQIVEMHGGRIWVESTTGQGSTFQMELPTRAATR